MSSPLPEPHPRCVSCGTELAPSRLACPSCQRLVHAERLEALAAAARQAEADGRLTEALAQWREAHELLPFGSVQEKTLAERIASLSARVAALPAASSAPAPPAPGVPEAPRSAWRMLWAPVVAGVTFLLTKGKLLLAGLGQLSTLGSMLLSLGVYWTAWGWRFAVGLILTMYVHEMGHVAELRRFGIKATAPMFVPGLGAFVRLKQYPASAAEDARVGLAGPIWGLGAGVAVWLLWQMTGHAVLAGIAVWTARLNLFNLMPLGSLDGGRGFRALARGERWAITALVGAALWLTGEKFLWLVLLLGVARAAFGQAPETGDRGAFARFALLVVLLSALSMTPVAVP